MTFATCSSNTYRVAYVPIVLRSLKDIFPRWILWLCLAEAVALVAFAYLCRHPDGPREDLVMTLNLTGPSLSNAPVPR